MDGPVLLRCLRDSGARNPRRHSTHSDRGPRSDSITILCGGWSAVESGEPGTGHCARCVPKQRPSKPRHCIDARSDGSPRSRPHDPTAPAVCGAGIPDLPSLPGLDSATQRSASLNLDPLASVARQPGRSDSLARYRLSGRRDLRAPWGFPQWVPTARRSFCHRKPIWPAALDATDPAKARRKWPNTVPRHYSTVAAQTISKTRRMPPSPPLLDSWNGVLWRGFQSSRSLPPGGCGTRVSAGSYCP